MAGTRIAGAAYVFVRSVTTWSQQAKLTASDGAASDVAALEELLTTGSPAHRLRAARTVLALALPEEPGGTGDNPRSAEARDRLEKAFHELVEKRAQELVGRGRRSR